MNTKYLDAAHALRQRLLHHSLSPGAPLPSTRLLASELGFSHAAMARACTVLIAAGILTRRGYQTTVAAGRPERPAVPGTIEIVSYLAGFAQAAARFLGAQGISHRITQLNWRKNPNSLSILKQLFQVRPAGVLLCLTRLDDGVESLLEATETPFVLCTDGVRRAGWSIGQADYYRGTEQALSHLYAQGHRFIAHSSFADNFQDLAENHRAVCLKLGLRAASKLIWQPEIREVGDVRETVQAGLKRHPEVTALVAELEIAEFAMTFLAIPQRLSVVSFGAEELVASPAPFLTLVEFPPVESIALWACTELLSKVERLQAGQPRRSGTQTMFLPNLMVRKSVQALAKSKPLTVTGNATIPKPHPHDTWQKIYPFLRKTRAHNWLQLDLAKLANHSITRHHGWLGAEPLEHFPPGLRAIHGVPFRVLDEARNGGRSVITFRSIRSHSTGGKQLPIRVKIKVNSRLEALYFLHGCGSARPTVFAQYVMHFGRGTPISVPLVALGISRRFAAKHLGELKPNIQDWWPEFIPVDFPHAHRAIVFNPADCFAYQRSIYSLEWINPRPKEELKFVEVVADPKAGPTLALIAVTALLY